MKPSNAAIDIIKHFEGLRLQAYKDGGGVWTIGYGSTEDVKPYQIITEENAIERLTKKLNDIGQFISQCVTVPLSQNQFDALCSFIYNVGKNAFRRSTLLVLLNQSLYASAAAQFRFWCMDNGKKIPGLVTRRFFERKLFTTTISETV